MNVGFSRAVMDLDVEATATRLCDALRRAVVRRLRRRGVVVAVSGGVDSACVVALAVRALGRACVHALIMPERDSSEESTRLAQALCERLGIEPTLADITPILAAAGCYGHRDAAVRSVFPGFEPLMRWKMVLDRDRLETGRLGLFSLVVEVARGEVRSFRLTPESYLTIVAATNFKQRTRKMMEYFHADRLHFAVAGTPNRLEHDQGFFVKLGDGAADVKPIATLYKSQVYALARHLGVMDEITRRPPTTDTYSLPQSQEEFYFSLDLLHLDLVLWARDHDIPPEVVARELRMTPEHVARVYEDIERRRRAAEYLHAAPILIE
jgi:NAD+ synthase